MDYLGNGRMIAAMEGPDILSIHAPSISGPALCSLVCKEFVRTKTELDNTSGILTNHSHNDHLKFRSIDYIDPEDCILIRKIDTYERICFKICVPPQALFTIYNYTNKPERAVIALPKGTPYSTGLATRQERFLLIAVSGAGSIQDNGTIEFQTGTSYLFFIGGEPDEFYLSEGEMPSGKAIYERVLKQANPLMEAGKLRDIISRQSVSGGVISSAYLGECIVSDQLEYLRELLRGKQAARARRIVDYLIRLYTLNGFVPYSASADGEPILRGALTNALTPAYAAICAKEYYEATKDIKYLKENIKILAQITALQLTDIKTSHLSFNGGEPLFDGTVSSSLLFEGSRLSDQLFVESAEALLAMISLLHCSIKGTAAMARAKDKVKEALGDYEKDGQRMANVYSRYSIARKPKSLYFHCEYCRTFKLQTYERLCIRNKFGHYVCPACLKEPPPEKLPGSVDLLWDEISQGKNEG